jgi:hypothetical protein
MTDSIEKVTKEHPVDFLTQVVMPAIRGELLPQIKETLRDYVTGEAADLQQFAIEIVGDTARAVARGDHELIQDLENQILLLAELHRIKLNKQANAVMLRILTIVGQVLLQSGQLAISTLLKSV